MKNGEYTTICIDKYGCVYDLSKEHPSWEQEKEDKKQWGGGGGNLRPIVVNAYSCLVEEIPKGKKKKK